MTTFFTEEETYATKGNQPTLFVDNLCIDFHASNWPHHEISAVDDVSFALYPGKTLCLVGESGCGKSVTARSILRLLPSPPAKYTQGHIFFQGQDLALLSEKNWQKIRGNNIAMIFQEPMTSLNPVLSIGEQTAEHIALHKNISYQKAKVIAIQMLDKTGIPNPEARWYDFPHQLSGGMRQRVMIAMAMACAPDVLIADEPTTALDVSIQQQILQLMDALVKEKRSSLLLITHDFNVVKQAADYVAVMYAGRIVEHGPCAQILSNPLHPYTQGLLNAQPSLQTKAAAPKRTRLYAIPGTVPPLGKRPPGCAFHPRCPKALPKCVSIKPRFILPTINAWKTSSCHQAACWLYHAT